MDQLQAQLRLLDDRTIVALLQQQQQRIQYQPQPPPQPWAVPSVKRASPGASPFPPSTSTVITLDHLLRSYLLNGMNHAPLESPLDGSSSFSTRHPQSLDRFMIDSGRAIPLRSLPTKMSCTWTPTQSPPLKKRKVPKPRVTLGPGNAFFLPPLQGKPRVRPLLLDSYRAVWKQWQHSPVQEEAFRRYLHRHLPK